MCVTCLQTDVTKVITGFYFCYVTSKAMGGGEGKKSLRVQFAMLFSPAILR